MSKQNGDCHSSDMRPEQLTAYALGQLQGEELAAVKAAVGEGASSAAGEEIREVQTMAAAIQSARHAEPSPEPSVELRTAIEQRLAEAACQSPQFPQVELPAAQRWWRPTIMEWFVAGGICVVLAGLMLPAVQSAREASRRVQAQNNLRQMELDLQNERTVQTAAVSALEQRAAEIRARDQYREGSAPAASSTTSSPTNAGLDEPPKLAWRMATADPRGVEQYEWTELGAEGSRGSPTVEAGGIARDSPRADGWARGAGLPGQGQASGYGGYGSGGYGGSGGYPGGAPGLRSRYPGELSSGGQTGAQIASNPVPETAPGGEASLLPSFSEDAVRVVGAKRVRREGMEKQLAELESKRPASGTEYRKYYNQRDGEVAEHGVRLSKSEYDLAYRRTESEARGFAYRNDPVSGEQYEPIVENAFLSPLSDPLSTFSIDVDTASYANVRRFLNEGRLPPPSAVRIEELVNYFTYSYPQPAGREPFSVNMEAAECPWSAGHLLLRVGLKGKEVHRSERPPSNLTFLLDVSGSMQDANKLPLLKTTLMMFVAELTENDRVSIVTYAGEAGLRLPPTRGHEKEKIMAAIDSLSAGGSTHGSAGIQLAYEQARQYFLKEGTNRVILATDGDLNVGVTSDDALVELIKEKAAGGTFLTVLGFGTGNLKDGKLEKLADNGNGVYAYIDGVREGRKVLVEQMSGNLVTIAKDVKIQIEFNPAQIASYRLLGYENRVLAAADFNNDKKDAGEFGAGHTVTVLYELVPVGTNEVAAVPQVGEPLKYQEGARGREGEGERNSNLPLSHSPALPLSAARARLTEAAASGELLTLKLRYKEPDGVESRLVEFPLKERGGQFHSASKDLQFAVAVASFGMILRGSEHRGSGNLASVAEIAGGAIGDDPSGYRAEFVDLVRKAQALGAK